MWKTLIFSCVLSISAMASEENAHLQELKKNFPYALLTDDFGILNHDDLKINQCIAEPSLFSQNVSTPYPYWQCFDIKDAKMECEGRIYSAEEKSRMSMLVITGARKNELNEFISRRPMKLKTCRLYLHDWARLTKNENHVCISGNSISSNMHKKGQKKSVWIFDRYKTKKGCESYFSEMCIFGKKDKEICVVD